MLKISPQLGVVVRKAKLTELTVTPAQLLEASQTQAAFDEDEALLSLGPHFGEEAITDLCDELTKLGFEEFEDYFVFRGDVPEWCLVGCALAPAPAGS